MLLRVGDPHLVSDLLGFLRGWVDCIASEAGDGFVEVSLLGSRSLAENLVELDDRLDGWRVRHAGVTLELAAAA